MWRPQSAWDFLIGFIILVIVVVLIFKVLIPVLTGS